jgi:hypothetical protein
MLLPPGGKPSLTNRLDGRAMATPLTESESQTTNPEFFRQAGCFRVVYDSTPRYVNDHSIIRGPDGLFHLFHIEGPQGAPCYTPGAETTFGHATSRDLLHWRDEGSMLAFDSASP